MLFYNAMLSCANCHDPANGRRLAPDLASKRDGVTDRFLVDLVLHPPKDIRKEYSQLWVLTVDGVSVMGFKESETNEMLVLREPVSGKQFEIAQVDIRVLQTIDRFGDACRPRQSECDGVFIDQMHGNVGFRKDKAKEVEKAMGEMMAALKQRLGADKILLGNNANNDDAKYAYPVCDAIMFENYSASRFTKESLLKEWGDMLRIAQDGKISVFRLCVDGTGRGNLKPGPEMITLSKEKFALACYLIGAQPYSYFMYSWRWLLSTGPLVDYPEFQKPLGAPKGAYNRTTPGGWEFTRAFEHASVWVNTETRQAKITWR